VLDAELHTWGDLFVVHGIDGLLSALWAILLVLIVWIIVTDEGKLADLVGLENKGLDVSEWLEQFDDVILRLLVGNVLDIDVVDQSSELSAVLGLEFHLVNALGNLSVQGVDGTLLLLEANESVSSGGVVRVEGDLETLDLSALLEHLVQVLVLDILWHLDEDVVVVQLVLVATEQLLVEWKGTALLAVDLEVLHLLASLFELLGVLDADHGGVEWSGDVSLDLWLGVEDNSGFVLEGDCNLVAADLVLGKIVQVDKLGSVHCISRKFLIFYVCMVVWVCFVFLYLSNTKM